MIINGIYMSRFLNKKYFFFSMFLRKIIFLYVILFFFLVKDISFGNDYLDLYINMKLDIEGRGREEK